VNASAGLDRRLRWGSIPAEVRQFRGGGRNRQICELCCDAQICKELGVASRDPEPGTAQAAAAGSGVGDDRRLLEALRRGDEAAFAELVESYGPMLMRLALAHTPSRAVAEEVVQDTWLAVLQGIDRFEGRSSLRTWVISILLNKARTKGERERRILPFSVLRRSDDEGRAEPSVPPDRFQGPDGEFPGHWSRPPVEWGPPEDKLAEQEARDVMLEAIAALPARQREAITMRDILGLSAEEARNALGISETNQRVLLHRARSKVRAALESHFAGTGVPDG
jgi:RNA polymerase sigma-70 factor (ECF subfamily)